MSSSPPVQCFAPTQQNRKIPFTAIHGRSVGQISTTSKGLTVLPELAFQVHSFKHMLRRVDRPKALSSMNISFFRLGTDQTYVGLGSHTVALMTVKL